MQLAYKQVLAKCYAGLAVSGQVGPYGNPDISGIDEGFSQYLREYWYAQELTTDEAVISWNDGTLKDYHYQTWTSAGEFIGAMYNRIYYQISLCNEFIREAQPAKVASRGITGAAADSVATYLAEARFLRAFSYWHALDLFGNIPFVDENNTVGAFLPAQKSRTEIFSYVESELLDLATKLKDAKTNEYGRVDKAAAWMLLGKLYLNAKVYTGTDRSTDCLTYIKQVIASPYSLDNNYAHLFMADNNTSNEIIFPITFDGLHTQGYGGTTFIIHAEVGGSMSLQLSVLMADGQEQEQPVLLLPNFLIPQVPQIKEQCSIHPVRAYQFQIYSPSPTDMQSRNGQTLHLQVQPAQILHSRILIFLYSVLLMPT